MPDRILDHLEFLYGESTARWIEPQVRQLMRKYSLPAAQERSGKSLALSERDSLLITYGDQVREEGRAPLQTLAEFAEAHLKDILGGVHVLPFYPYSSDDGFSVVDYFQVDPKLGAWGDLAHFQHSFSLMFDAVFNHISAQSDWFQCFLRGDPAYRDHFITVDGEPDLSAVVRPRALPLLTKFQTLTGERKVWTTFSADQIDVNVRNPAVLLALLDALLFYVSKGARFIRLDAIAYLWKEIGTSCIHRPQTHRIVQLMRSVLDEAAPGVMLITETNVPHQDNVSYFGDGRDEAQLVYNFALPPLVLNAFHTGRATALSRWTASLRPPSDCVAFFNFLSSHDGIGVNPVRGILPQEEIDALGERALAHGGYVSYKHNPDGSKSPYELNINYYDALNDPRAVSEPMETKVNRFMAAQAIMLALAGMPGIYFHSLFGSRGDHAAAEASGIPRRINRQKLLRSDLERDLARPDSLRAQVFRRYCDLLKVRRSHPAFHPLAGQEVLEAPESVFSLLRTAVNSNEQILCLQNVANARVTARLIVPGRHRTWRELLNGRTYEAPAKGALTLDMEPYQVLWAEACDRDV